MGLVDRIDAKHGTFKIGQRAYLVLHILHVLGGYVDQHHQRKVARPETARHGRAHVPARVDDDARHVRHNAQTIQTSRVNDQRFGGIAMGRKGLRGEQAGKLRENTVVTITMLQQAALRSHQPHGQHQPEPQYNQARRNDVRTRPRVATVFAARRASIIIIGSTTTPGI
jgi:hypothetical protein